MLQISTKTSKRELLELLAAQAGESQKLVIEVISLPTFLTTPIAFTIFTYQISNYPRKIAWTSKNPTLIEFLKTCNVEVIPDTKTVDSFKNQTISDKEFENGNFNQVDDQVIEEKTSKPNVTTFKLNAERLFKKERYKSSALLETSKVFGNEDGLNETTLNQEPSQKRINEAIDTTQGVFNTQSSNQVVFQPEPIHTQDLDNWLERIEATRLALSSFSQPETQLSKKSNKFSRILSFSFLTLVLSSFIFGIWMVFPTNVYSVDVQNQVEETTTTFALDRNKFLLQNRNLNVAGEGQASGDETITLTSARGQVTIVNRSGGVVNFDRQGIILVAPDGREYRHVPVSGEPGTFSVPARSDIVGKNLVINVEASRPGSDFNLPVGTSLRILNLRRSLIGNLLTGTVSEEISTVKATGQKIVQEQDLENLRKLSNQKLVQSLQTEIESIRNETTFTDSKWSSVENVIYTFTRNVGDVAQSVGVTASGQAQIYYLNQSLLEEELKIHNQDLNKLLKVQEINFTGDFQQQTSTEEIQITVKYQFENKINLSQAQIANQLSNNTDFSKAKDQLKKEYPQIVEIEKKEQGIRLPGVPARVDININSTE